MFKLFGKKPEPVVEVTTAKKQYPAIVEEIHNEFYTAGDNILEEATCLLKQLESQDIAKGKRLAAIGFRKTREAVAATETENKLTTTKEIAKLVMYYKLNYPNNKFITEEQVKQICEKYGLVCGEISAYKGFVPENKLKMIESFNVKKEDGSKMYKYGYNKKTLSAWYESNSKEFVENDVIKSNEISVELEQLKICAPLKDMEVKSNQQVVGYKIQNIPDPVVLQPVRGGYLCVCAWGDEASDEIVVNEKMN